MEPPSPPTSTMLLDEDTHLIGSLQDVATHTSTTIINGNPLPPESQTMPGETHIMPSLLAGGVACGDTIKTNNIGDMHSDPSALVSSPHFASPGMPLILNYGLPSITSTTPSLLQHSTAATPQPVPDSIDRDPFGPYHFSSKSCSSPSHSLATLVERESRTPPRSPKPSRSHRASPQHPPYSPHAMDIDGLPLSPSLDPTPLSMNNIRMEPNISEAGAEMLLSQSALDSDLLDNTLTTPVSAEPPTERKLCDIQSSTLTAIVAATVPHWPDVPADRQVKVQADSGVDLVADVQGDVDATMLDATSKKPIIPAFYFPLGQNPNDGATRRPDALAQKYLFGIDDATSIGRGLTERDFEKVSERLQLPRYLNASLFRHCGGERTKPVYFDAFQKSWAALASSYRGEESLAFAVLKKPANNFVEPDDFEFVVTDVVQHHPGLAFLGPLPVFQARYVETVVSRIYYSKTQNWNNRMTYAEFKQSAILNVIKNLETQDDINSTRDVFSYKHFYVIYCKFWELDTDHDMQIDRRALGRYDRSSIIPRVVSRLAEGAGRPVTGAKKATTMGYRDFIWFILSNEDKRSPQGIEYWFRVLDFDGDGLISLHELKHYWEEQHAKMIENRLADPWKFDDFVCALLDLVKPAQKHAVSLRDLKKCGSASIFFDMIFDLRKYDSFVRRIDPAWREMDDVVVMDARGRRIKLEGWDKFSERAYEELANEESQQRTNSYRSTSRYVYDDEEDDTTENWAVKAKNASVSAITESTNDDRTTMRGKVNNDGDDNNNWPGGMFSHTASDTMDEDWVEDEEDEADNACRDGPID
ncbi:hypothetical protein SeLEV6574_g03574 [Synchytrium endobioticum]|nr:hypothetical protein SeLEV6574_g03574 [Synchytrium endobioticum]